MKKIQPKVLLTEKINKSFVSLRAILNCPRQVGSEIKCEILSDCSALGLYLHGRMDAQPPLETGEIVISDILPDHPGIAAPGW